ncbi:uncharacterized protein DMENIID0001_100670 [Sergentomyia squamirostris]
MGDYNASNPLWGSGRQDNRGFMIEESLMSENLIILNDGTKTNLSLAYGTFNAVDLTLVDPFLGSRFSWVVDDDLHGSDHYPISLFDLEPNTQLIPKCEKWIEGDADWNLFNHLLGNNELQLDFNSIGLQESYNSFIQCVYNAAKESIPTSRPKQGKRCVPWWNREIRDLIKMRKRSLRRFKKHPTGANKDSYLEVVDKVKGALDAAKLSSFRQFSTSISMHTTSREMWGKIKAIRGRETSSIRRVDCNFGSSTDPIEMTNLLAKKFASSSSTNTNDSNRKQQIYNAIPLVEHISPSVKYLNENFTPLELQRALRKSSGKSCGPNSITYSMLKNLPDGCLTHLLALFNGMWSSGLFPSDWKSSILVPIPKKSSSGNPDFRPIALSNCEMKVFERMVNYRLNWFLKKENLINDNQVGFRTGRACINAVSKLCGDVAESYSKRSHTTAIFCDLEGAYDKVWAAVIIKQLCEWGITGPILDFIKFYLDTRNFRVRINSILSSEESMDNGVPQGGVLSVTLFLIAINGIFKIFTPDEPCKILVYADDIVIYNDTADVAEHCIQVQSCLNKVGNWSISNGFKFSTKKTKILHFCRKHRCVRTTFALNGSVLEYTDSYKYLGIWLDPKLSFKTHIAEVKSTCTSRMNVIKCLSGLSWGAHRDSLLTVHESTIVTKIFYGSEVFASAACATTLNSLNSIYNMGYRLSSGAFRTSPVNSLLAEVGVLPLSKRWEFAKLRTAVRMMATPSAPGHSDILNYEKAKNSKNYFNSIGPLANNILGDLTIEVEGSEQYPSWHLLKSSTNTRILSYNYKEMDTDELINLFDRICFGISRNYTVFYCDGSAYENKKGFAVTTETEIVLQERCHDSVSVFDLELLAIRKALKFCQDVFISPHSSHSHYIVASDSLSSITAVQNLKNASPSVTEARNLLIGLSGKVTLLWVPGHRGIPGNERVDHEAKAASQFPQVTYKTISLRGALTILKRYEFDKKCNWFTSEVSGFIRKSISKPIRPTIPANLSRKECVALARLRIGHTRFTQSYKMARQNAPVCPSCKKLLTVEHLLNECPKLKTQRISIFGNKVPSNLLNFSEANNSLIIKYLNSLEIFEEL